MSGSDLPEGLFAVRMQAQPVDQSGGWPMARLASGLAAPVGLPEPSALAPAAQSTKQSSYTAADLVHEGAEFDASLPLSRVSKVSAPSAIFAPVWGGQAQPVMSDAAYCVYRFNLGTYYASGEPQTLALAWDEGNAPADYKDLWIGLANRDTDRWDWFTGPEDGVLTLASYDPYTSGAGETLVAVVVLGSTDCALRSLKVGEPELRSLGALYGLGQDTAPPPSGAATLAGSVDLSALCSPVGDQGQTGACTAFATARGAFDYELGQTYGADGWNFTDSFNLGSPKYLYLTTGWEQGKGCGPHDGRVTAGVVDYLDREGDSTELNAPYLNICDADWGQAAEDDAALLGADGYTSISPTGVSGVQKLKYTLSILRKVVVLQTGVDWDFLGLQPDEVWNYGGGGIIGFHALALVGYDDAKQAFKVRNSWGTDWAAGGYCWIGYQTFLAGSPDLAMWAWSMDVDYRAAVAQRFLEQQKPLAAPTNLQATDGTYTYKIRLIWNKSAGATGYKVYRDRKYTLVATLGDVASWDDPNPGDSLSHYYWVRATTSSDSSDFGNADGGFLAQAPAILNVSPQGGAPGALVTFTATVEGSAPLTYSWNFGGGATPNTSSDHSPQVTLGAEGTYDATLTVTNDYGDDTYGFAMSVGDYGICVTAFDIQAAGATGGGGWDDDVFTDGMAGVVQSNGNVTLGLYSVSGTYYGAPFSEGNLASGMTQADYDEVEAMVSNVLNWDNTYAGATGARATSTSWFDPNSSNYAGVGNPGFGHVIPDDDPESGTGNEEGVLDLMLASGDLGTTTNGDAVTVPEQLDAAVSFDMTADPNAPVIEGYYTTPDFSTPYGALTAGGPGSNIFFVSMDSWGASGTDFPANPEGGSCQLCKVDGKDASAGALTLLWDTDGDLDGVGPEPGEYTIFQTPPPVPMDIFQVNVAYSSLEYGAYYALRWNDGTTWSSINLPANMLGTNMAPPPVDLQTVPAVVDRNILGAKYIQVFHSEPKIRRDGRVNVSTLYGTVEPIDAEAYGDLLKQGSLSSEFGLGFASENINGHEVFVPYPKIIVAEGSDPAIITDLNYTGAIDGVLIPLTGGREPGRVVADITSMVLNLPPLMPGGSHDFCYKVFNNDTSCAGSGIFTVVDTPMGYAPPVGGAWGVDTGSRGTWELADFNTLCNNFGVDGTTMNTPEPDMLWVRFNSGTNIPEWDDYWGGQAGTSLQLRLTDLNNSASQFMELLLVGVAAGGDYIAVHHFDRNDGAGFYYDWSTALPGGGILVPGHSYTIQLHDPANPAADYTFADPLTCYGNNPNI